MAVTQKQIAERLGVSQVLVSHALNDYKGIAEGTRHRIQEEAQRMGYHRHSNRAARELIARRYGRRARSGIIAVLMRQFFGGETTAGTPFFTPLLLGIQDEASRRDIDVFLCSTHGGLLPNLVRDGTVDGIISFASDVNVAERASEIALPCIHLAITAGGWCLHADDRQGTFLAARHLLDLGHRRIAYVGQPPHFPGGRHRLEGYRKALLDRGLPVDDQLVEATVASPSFDCGTEAMVRMLRRTRDISGLVCYNDLLAMGAVRALAEAGLAVPGEVSVVGFDDVSPQYNFQPALTSIAFDRAAMGRRAVELLDYLVERPAGGGAAQVLEPQAEVFPVELVVRESTRARSGG